MADDRTLGQVLERLDALERENRMLRARLGRLERRRPAADAREQDGAGTGTRTTSRRGLLTILGLTAGAGAATLAFRPGVAAAATDSLVELGANNSTEATTELSYDGTGAPTNGSVLAVTDSATGYINADAALLGCAVGGNVHHGVSGYTTTTGGNGVVGTAAGTSGRGGVFSGPTAQIQLTPGSAASHPSSGQAGDLYVDSTGRLWICKGTTTWTELTATGSGSPTVPIARGWNLLGVAQAAAGLMASHVLSVLLGQTGGTLAALFGLTGSQWTPRVISNNGHTSGTDFALVAGQGYLLYSDTKLAGFTLQAPIHVSGVTSGGQGTRNGPGGGTLPPVPVLPGQH